MLFRSTTDLTNKKIVEIWRSFEWDRNALDARINMLIQEDKARTLANPKLVTLSGKEASFVVGGEIPYVTVETEGRTRVEWRDYGVGLKILPVVNADRAIRTTIEAEVSDLDWANAVEEQDHRIPAVKKRSAQTEIMLNDGDTIIIGGLIKNEDSRNVDRLPWLSKVPILGELFKSTAFRDKRTELVISLTPKLIGLSARPEDVSGEMEQQESFLGAETHVAAKEQAPFAFYASLIEDIISRNLVYPDEAREAQQEGVVEVDLRLSADGQLQEAQIRQSSGFNALDQAALSAVEDISPYPSFPPQITQKVLRLTIPVVFKAYVKND